MPSPPHAAELLILFVKYPEPGRVKTRLAVGVGPEQAAAIYQDLVQVAWSAASTWCHHASPSTSCPPASRTLWIYFDPPSRESDMKAWFARYASSSHLPITWIAQPEGDLGERLEYVFNKAFNDGFSAVFAIGTDCPSLTAKGLETASLRLRLSDAVLGPAADGGYYLIGLTQYHPNAFRKIPWSSPQTPSVSSNGTSPNCPCSTTSIPKLIGNAGSRAQRINPTRIQNHAFARTIFKLL
jgi:rSAM/selenodomain-associated transferase 1